jgi:hypothetical protein
VNIQSVPVTFSRKCRIHALLPSPTKGERARERAYPWRCLPNSHPAGFNAISYWTEVHLRQKPFESTSAHSASDNSAMIIHQSPCLPTPATQHSRDATRAICGICDEPVIKSLMNLKCWNFHDRGLYHKACATPVKVKALLIVHGHA